MEAAIATGHGDCRLPRPLSVGAAFARVSDGEARGFVRPHLVFWPSSAGPELDWFGLVSHQLSTDFSPALDQPNTPFVAVWLLFFFLGLV
jgi:hypothetical protein